MSGVYARNRNNTPFDPVDFAAALQDAITAYVMNEKRVPKRWRPTLGADLLRKTDELVDNVIAANETWAKDEKMLAVRMEYWRRAATNCKQIDRKLRRLQVAIPSATPDSMEEILKLLTDDEDAVLERKRHDKVVQTPGGASK